MSIQEMLELKKKVQLPRRVNPTCRSGRFRSDPHRISSESDGTRLKSDQIRPGFHRVPSNSDKIRVGIRLKGIRQKLCRIRSKLFRSDGIRSPLSHMGRWISSQSIRLCCCFGCYMVMAIN